MRRRTPPDAATSPHALIHAAEITTLGRGGSDTTAVALAARLGADRCQIFTDVRGIYTADPRLLPEARKLDVIGYEEMLEMAQSGAQVMQQRAVELGWVNDVVIEVLSSFEDAPGTLIKEDPFVEQRNKVRGLAHDRNVAKVTIVEVPDRPGVAHAIFAPLADAGVSVDVIVQNVSHGGTTDMSFTVTRTDLAEGAPDPGAGRPRARGARDHHRRVGREGLDRRLGDPERAGLRGPDVRSARRRRREHRGDRHQRDPDHLPHRRGQRRARAPLASRRVRARAARPGRRGGRAARATLPPRRGVVTEAPFLSHQEQFAVVGSTNDVVRGWLAAGTPEVCLAVADEQTAGRGREGRTWHGARRARRCCSRSASARRRSRRASSGGCPPASPSRWPTPPRRSPGLADGTIGSNGPTTSWSRRPPGGVRKVAGVLGESDGLGSDDPRVVIGIGINADWRRQDFPAELAASMSSLREASNGRPIDRGQLLDAFLDRLEARVVGLRQGWFAIGDWASRQVATGRMVRIEYPDGRTEDVRALGVDAAPAGSSSSGPRPGRGAHRPQRRDPPRPARRAETGRELRRSGCNEMAGSAFSTNGGAARRRRDRGRVVHLDRDRGLVEAAQRDPAAFDALYRRYLAQVYSFVYYELGHHADAEDVTERVFMQALSACPASRSGASRRRATPTRPRPSGCGCSRSRGTR